MHFALCNVLVWSPWTHMFEQAYGGQGVECQLFVYALPMK
jgi:membrane protein involved in colicin uptake